MNSSHTHDIATLARLVSAKSKHSDYQVIHPSLAALIPKATYQPSGKWEPQRQTYMSRYLPVNGLRILDIGANTGYFSLAAIDGGAHQVVSQEGNLEHAECISLGTQCLGIDKKVEVRPYYYDFSATSIEPQRYDIVLCLNVLHHLSDDFGDPTLSMDTAKIEMLNALTNLSKITDHCWMQLGFNWKGDCHRPLFQNGTKRELIDFIQQGTQKHWAIERIGVFNPINKNYEDANADNLQRFDHLGEFLNRPLFLLRSLKT